MKTKNVETKKIVHFLIIILMLLALVFGFVFSAVETSKGIKLGSQYRGSFQAVVGVYKVDQKEENKENLPSGDAKKGAEILQNKLSPFADGSINVTIDGVSRLIVTAPRDAYDNNQKLFANAIQSTGGLFIFNEKNTDVMLDADLMGKTGGLKADIAEKASTSELLGAVSQVSRPVGVTNRPFLKFDLTNDYFASLNKASDSAPGPVLKMIVDTPTLLANLRDYFAFATNDEQLDEYLQVFLDNVLSPLRNDIKDNKISGDAARILKDFFKIQYWDQNGDDSWSTQTASLVDPNFRSNDNWNLETVKKLLYADQNSEHYFEYQNDVTKYVYDPNAVGDDFTKDDGKYRQPLKLNDNQKDVPINEAFNALTNNLLPLLLDDKKEEKTPTNDNPFGIRDGFNKKLFADFFIYNGAVVGPIPTSDKSNQLPEANKGTIINSDFYVGTKNYTVAKTAAAQISQTTTGFTFHVFSVSKMDAIISNAMFIVSIVALLIIGLAIAIFILFFYRLMGLFTIIVAITIAGLTLLMHVVFGIVVGPEIIAIMFVLVGLIMDISVVMFEAFKNNIYLEKRPIITSFNISNRETLGLVVDVLLASLLPNIVLFWIGIGFLKNFATILTMGILFTFIFGVVVLRLLIYFTSHTSIWKKHPWLLPIDTSLDYDGRFIYHYLILSKQEKLDGYTSQSEISAKDLLQIKKLEERIQILKTKDSAFITKKDQKEAKRKIRWERKWRKQLQSYKTKRNKVKSKNRFAYLRINHYEQKIIYLNYLLNAGDNAEGESLSVINDQLTRIEQTTAKTGWITLSVTILCTILAIIMAFTIGLNYSINFGRGTQYYIYGNFVQSTVDQMSAAAGSIDWANGDDEKSEKIQNQLNKIVEDTKKEVEDKYDVFDEKEWQALSVYRGYRFLISNNYLQNLDNRIKGINFKNAVFAYGTDYSRIDPTSSSFVNEPWFSITTTNNLIPKNNGVKTAMQKFAGRYSGTGHPSAPTNDGGILGMSLEPHTAVNQMRQIAITFGIILLALLIYMLIRFKWTYYVALALGLILVLAFTISLIVIFRIPFTIEALAGILGVLGFALVSGMLFLGRGKSIIVSKDEKVLNDYFDQEIVLQVQKKQLKLDFKNQIREMKKSYRQDLKAIDKKEPEYRKTIKALKKAQTLEFNKFKNEQKTGLKKQVDELNLQISLEARKNNFLKEIFANVLHFGLLRTIFLASFYLAIGVIAAVTLPAIGIMGFTLVIGVVATTLVMITIVLPVWIQLERRRIRMRYGYKKFVNNLTVSHEEQIINGLND